MSDILWTCTGCNVSVTTEEGPMEMLARAGKPRHPNDLQWVDGDTVHYWMMFEYIYGKRPGGEEPSEAPPFEVDGQPYCPGCAQACGNCGTAIFSRSELEAGDSYALGSAFLPNGKYRKGDALCVGCFESCCEDCGEMPDDCDCHAENGQDNEEEEEEAYGT